MQHITWRGRSQRSLDATGIYVITNLLSNKLYVGQALNMGKRWAIHQASIYKLNVKTPLVQAMREDGIENFRIDVLEYCDPVMLNRREVFYIQELDSRVPNGYNATIGGSKGHSPQMPKRKPLLARQGTVYREPPSMYPHTKLPHDSVVREFAAQPLHMRCFDRHLTVTTHLNVSPYLLATIQANMPNGYMYGLQEIGDIYILLMQLPMIVTYYETGWEWEYLAGVSDKLSIASFKFLAANGVDNAKSFGVFRK